MNFGIIASMCRDCAQMENGTADKVICKESIARVIDEVIGTFQGEVDLEVMCQPKYEYWRDVLTHIGSVCAKCDGSQEIVYSEMIQYIRKDSKPPKLEIVKKKKPAKVINLLDRKNEGGK